MIINTQLLLCFSHSVVSDSLWPHGLQSTRLLCLWDFPGKDTGVGCHFLLQGIFLTQGSKPGLLNCRQILYRMSYKGSPNLLLAMLGFPQVPSCPVCFSSLSSSLYCWNFRMLSTCLWETMLAWQVPGLSFLLSMAEKFLVISASLSTSNLILIQFQV